MATERDTRSKSEVWGLVGGIKQDVQTLIRQQIALFRHQIGEEADHAREAGSYILAGLAIVLTSALLLSQMVVHLLALLIPDLPLWVCFGIVGLPLAILGGVMLLTGMRKLDRDDEATADSPLDLEEKYDA